MSVIEILHAFVKKNDDLLNTINECRKQLADAPNIPGLNLKEMAMNAILLLEKKKKELTISVAEFIENPEQYKEEIKKFIT